MMVGHRRPSEFVWQKHVIRESPQGWRFVALMALEEFLSWRQKEVLGVVGRRQKEVLIVREGPSRTGPIGPAKLWSWPG